MVSFVVLPLYAVNGIRHEIIKHDCAHGKYHIHRYYEGPHVKVVESSERISDKLYWSAKRDVLENWLNYRMRYVRKYLTKH